MNILQITISENPNFMLDFMVVGISGQNAEQHTLIRAEVSRTIKNKRLRHSILLMSQENKRVLKPAEIQKLIPEKNTKKTTRERMILKTTLMHGLRNQEALKLKRRHIDIEGKMLEVVDGKGGKDRMVPIPDSFVDEFQEYIDGKAGNQYIFPSPYGGHFSASYFQKMIRRRAYWAELYENYNTDKKITYENIPKLIPYSQRIVPHSLRHTYATMQLRNNISVDLVSKALGHSKTSTTSDLYGHLNVEDTRPGINETFEDQNWA